MKDYFKFVAAVHILFIRDGKLLLLRRANTGYEDGNYSLVAGHADGNERMTTAAIREAREESGVDIDPKDLRMVLVMHRLSDCERIDFFFAVEKWSGDIKNNEPEKCDDLSWFPLDGLPPNVIPYIQEAIRCYQAGITYTEFGWK